MMGTGGIMSFAAEQRKRLAALVLLVVLGSLANKMFHESFFDRNRWIKDTEITTRLSQELVLLPQQITEQEAKVGDYCLSTGFEDKPDDPVMCDQAKKKLAVLEAKSADSEKRLAELFNITKQTSNYYRNLADAAKVKPWPFAGFVVLGAAFAAVAIKLGLTFTKKGGA